MILGSVESRESYQKLMIAIYEKDAISLMDGLGRNYTFCEMREVTKSL